HGVDAQVQSVQPFPPHQRFYGLGREAEGQQLVASDDTVLGRGQLRQTWVVWWLLSSPQSHHVQGRGRPCDETRRVWNLSATFAQQERCNRGQRRDGQQRGGAPRRRGRRRFGLPRRGHREL